MTDRDTTGGGELGDLPGLEGRPTRELVEGWTDDDWAAWFRDEVVGTPRWEKLASSYHPGKGFGLTLPPEARHEPLQLSDVIAGDEPLTEHDFPLIDDGDRYGLEPKNAPVQEFATDGGGDVEEALRNGAWRIGKSAAGHTATAQAHNDAMKKNPDAYERFTGHKPAEMPLTDPTEAFDVFFSQLLPEQRLGFFEAWYRVQEAPGGRGYTGIPYAGTYIGDEDSIVPEMAGPPTPDPFGLPPKEPEPVTGTEGSSPRLSPTVMAIGGALALALVLILVFTLLGGDEQAAEPEGIEFNSSFGSATYFGPTSFAAGEPIEVTIEYRDANGDPIAGATLYFSLISSDDEAHFETVTDENGLAVFKGPGPATAGTYQVLASDGGEPWEITVAEVT